MTDVPVKKFNRGCQPQSSGVKSLLSQFSERFVSQLAAATELHISANKNNKYVSIPWLPTN